MKKKDSDTLFSLTVGEFDELCEAVEEFRYGDEDEHRINESTIQINFLKNGNVYIWAESKTFSDKLVKLKQEKNNA